MESSLITSLIGIILFSVLMYFGFKYSTGHWNVSEEKVDEYNKWVNERGEKIKKAIIIISIIYGAFMVFQIYNILK